MNRRSNERLAHTQRNSLGMDRLVYTQLLKKLNHEHLATTDDVHPTRLHTRLEYHEPYLELELENNDRMRSTITVATRNISRGGISVLHSSFVYPGTNVRTKLSKINDTPCMLSGKVVRCEHRGGVVHEVGISFDRQIIVQEFIRPDICDCIRTHERVVHDALKGTVLIVGSDPTVIPFMREILEHTEMHYGFEESAAESLKSDLDRFDLIITCLNAGDMTGPEFTRSLREHHYTRPVIIAGNCDNESTRNQIRLSTADALITVPVAENDILCTLGEFLLTEWDEKILNALRKHNCSQTSDSLRGELAKLGIMLDQHTRTGDAVQIFGTCNKIKSIAPLLGLTNLRDFARIVGDSIASSGDPKPHTEELKVIKTMCTDRASAA